MRGDEHLRLRILQHIAQTLVGIFEVKRCIGRAGLVDGQHGERELLETVEHHADEVVGFDAKVYQLVSQRIRIAVHLTVSQLAVPVDHGGVVRRAPCLFGEQVGKGLAQVYVDLLTRTYLNNTLGLLVADNADAGQGSVGLCHHPLYRHLHGISEALHQAGGVLAIVIFHTDTGLSGDRSNEESDGELGYLEFHILYLQRGTLTDVLAVQAQLIDVLYLSRQSVVSGNLCERIVLVAQCLVEVFADLLQEFLHGLFSDGSTQGQRVDKHTYGVADMQVAATA